MVILEIIWNGHAAFKIVTESGKVIYLDPYKIGKEEQKADIIVSSHTHGDHFDKRSIKNVFKESTVLLGPASISSTLERNNGKGLKLGETFEVDDIKITLVPAYTIKKSSHPKEKQWSGTIIETEGKRIYHAGDTERIPEMKDLKDITVALICCGGTYTMDFEESCSAVLDFKPEIVVPMHNWDKDLSGFKDLMNKKDPSIKVEILTDKSLKL